MGEAEFQEAARYSAFISYSHKDAAFARRLHRQLETYRLPRRLAASHASRITANRRLRPLFRDQSGFAAAPDLNDAVQQAIAESGYLIVICSQDSQASDWVAREVAYFRSRRGPGGILAVLIEGATPEALSAAFGYVTPAECVHLPLAADFRRAGDGKRLALLKLVAVLAGVRLDELVQRDAQRRVRQITFVSGGALAGMAVMGALTFTAMIARTAAEHERHRGEAVIDALLNDLRVRLQGLGRLDLLDATNKDALKYYQGEDIYELSEAQLEQRAQLLQAIGSDDEDRDNYQEALAQFEEAKRTTDALTPVNSDIRGRLYTQAQSAFWIADLEWKIGDYPNAEQGYRKYAEVARDYSDTDPSDFHSLMEMGYAHSNLGMVFCHSLDLKDGKAHFALAMEYFYKAFAMKSANPNIESEIADGYADLGDVERLAGNCDGALKNRIAQQSILNHLLFPDKTNANLRAQLITNQLAMARIDICRGPNFYRNAVEKLEFGEVDALNLIRNDKENKEALREYRMLELFKARTWMMMPAESRPAEAVISSAVGSCAEDAKLPYNREATAFCFLQKAHHLAQTGKVSESGKLLTELSIWFHFEPGTLTGRWSINLAEEMQNANSSK